MSDLPKKIELHEEGPREGFQFETKIYPLQERVRIVNALSKTGIKQIQVASFVNPSRVPQMADAKDFFAKIKKQKNIKYTALWLNERGFRKAQQCPEVDLSGVLLLYASDAFSRRNNGCSALEVRAEQTKWIKLYKEAQVPIEAAYIMTAFGCHLTGDIPMASVMENIEWVINTCHDYDVPLPAIYLADTIGWAVPKTIQYRVGAVRDRCPRAKIGLHLHDTRGSGLANVFAALQMGVSLFDSSIAGLGGCPFAGHGLEYAAGNVCTEDIVFMAEEMGIDTGIDLDALIEASRIAETVIGRPLPGKIMHAGSLAQYRGGV